jgi:hypothetical protein
MVQHAARVGFMISDLKGSVQVSVHQSYLVRLWQSTEQGSWQASAQCVQNGHIVLFSEIKQLLVFLQEQVNHDAESRFISTKEKANARAIEQHRP